jgi:hypothetical protein
LTFGTGTKKRRRWRPTSPSMPPFSWAPFSPGLAVAGLEAVVAAQGDEALGLDPVAPAQDPGHERPGVVVADPGGHPAEPGEGGDVALEERLLALRAEGDVDRDARVGEAQLEDRDLRALAADEDIGQAEVDLGFGAGLVVGDDRDVDVIEVQLAAARPDVPADGGLGDIGALLVDEALPDPAGGVALLAGRVGVLGSARPDRLGMGADRRLGAGFDGLARWRDRGREGLADRPPVHPVPARQLADRHPFLPLVPADTLELLHPRQLLPPSLVMASQDQSSVRTLRSGVGPVLMIKLAESGASSGDHAHGSFIYGHRKLAWADPIRPTAAVWWPAELRHEDFGRKGHC